MAIYTNDVTNENGIINAVIFMNGNRVIVQPHDPYKTEPFASEQEAQEWADSHCAELEAAYAAGLAAEEKKKELEDAQLAALKAQIDTAAYLKTIVDSLSK